MGSSFPLIETIKMTLVMTVYISGYLFHVLPCDGLRMAHESLGLSHIEFIVILKLNPEGNYICLQMLFLLQKKTLRS